MKQSELRKIADICVNKIIKNGYLSELALLLQSILVKLNLYKSKSLKNNGDQYK
jgi:hypothetical protein